VLVLEQVLHAAIRRLGGGPYGRAAALLFGADPTTRGRLLKDRRRIAADELDVLPSTFRRNYEQRLIDDIAFEVWRIARTIAGPASPHPSALTSSEADGDIVQ
jgi:hypothetical protein